MKRGRTILVVTVLVLMAVGAVGLCVLGGQLDVLVARAIEKHGSRLTGTEVTVGGVDLELREGRITIREVRVANPGGFSERPAIVLDSFVLDVDPGSLRAEPYVVDALAVGDVALLYEVAADGRRNLDVIRGNLEAAQGGNDAGGGASAPDEAAPAPLLVIDRLELAGGAVEVDASALDLARRTARAPGFTLTDLGVPDGAPAPELGRLVLRRLVDQAVDAAVEGELKQRLRDLLGGEEGQDLEDTVKDKVGDLLGG